MQEKEKPATAQGCSTGNEPKRAHRESVKQAQKKRKQTGPCARFFYASILIATI
ncbi:MAG: hypothetical protein ACRYF5_10155 [Janthinobacterium lividum]